ncbi:conserved hypothetical protein [Talaromyces stipitatus ATCC 10500]|uniref:MHD domain-containing protein n=1 Tax=Talaromyces stipitatus (strain ATCC 10500 / CBS 375.48 / QM 6759 / NRRL 1006) TaxID=441959 RepID=B8M228_TALSN|nr:uncharacterized protein TSTA_087280 [Talaromyces stipitatus ATCC 10500]EED21492.1 conserved hypothetical protein [Talaromyces stipitatus ATCC 10500]
MELSRQEYPALLTSLQPNQATAVLNDRIRLINKVNTDIADWLQERRRVEELYVQGLRKLARRPQLDGGAALGIFQLPWNRITSATEALAASHEVLAAKIEEDVERPLREYGSRNQELSAMPTIHSDLTHLAKGLEAAQKKLEKAKEKGAKGADKVAAAVASVTQATQQWESQAPFVFEQLQAIDESRLNHLRDVLTQLQTHEVDQIERSRQTAESCLNVLLNIQTEDEIKTFAAKINGGREPVLTRNSSVAAERVTPAAIPSSEDLPPPPRFQDDAASQHSNRSGRAARVPPPVPEPRHTPRMGGLRRLGTVMNRRKSVVLGSGTSIPTEKKSRPGFGFRRGDSSSNVHTQLPSTPPGRDTPSIAGESIGSPPPTASTANEYIQTEDTTTITPIPETNETAATTNGLASNHADTAAANQIHVDSEGYSERPQLVDDITQAQREASGLEDTGLNLTIRDQPIQEDETQAQQALNETANALRMQGLQVGLRRNAGTIRGRRDVRNTAFIAPSTAAEILPPSLLSTSAATSPGGQLESPAPISATPSHEDRAMSDTTSIHSSHTLHTIAGPVSHPELHEPGLNASIIETVSSWFENSNVTKSFVVGELALAYNATPGSTTSEHVVRLDNFVLLEKVAANPHFVTEVSKTDDEKRGEYNVAVEKIARAIPTVAFKYQVHIAPPDLASYSPVLFRPVWNIEEFQASVIVFYSVNPAFVDKPATGSLHLKNVMITVNLDLSPEDETTKQPREVVRATGAVMYPNTGALFRRKHSAVVWKIPELEVRVGSEEKLLARFTTSASWPRKGKVEAKFEHHTTDSTSRLGVSLAETAGPGTTDQAERDPFADDGSIPSQSASISTSWKPVHTLRKLAAGKYVAS